MSKNTYLDNAKPTLPKLGRAKDFKKEFGYTQPKLDAFEAFEGTPVNSGSLLNSASTKYNIINHTRTAGQIYNKELPEVRQWVNAEHKGRI
jgi:hypothetical protein